MATTGQRAHESAAVQITGVIGSCMWRTSKRSRFSAPRTRGIADGLSTMFGSAPFAGTITERPTGITSAGGRPCRPCLGCRTRVKLPSGSCPTIVRVSMPSSRSAATLSSTCSITAPQ